MKALNKTTRPLDSFVETFSSSLHGPEPGDAVLYRNTGRCTAHITNLGLYTTGSRAWLGYRGSFALVHSECIHEGGICDHFYVFKFSLAPATLETGVWIA